MNGLDLGDKVLVKGDNTNTLIVENEDSIVDVLGSNYVALELDRLSQLSGLRLLVVVGLKVKVLQQVLRDSIETSLGLEVLLVHELLDVLQFRLLIYRIFLLYFLSLVCWASDEEVKWLDFKLKSEYETMLFVLKVTVEDVEVFLAKNMDQASCVNLELYNVVFEELGERESPCSVVALQIVPLEVLSIYIHKYAFILKGYLYILLVYSEELLFGVEHKLFVSLNELG